MSIFQDAAIYGANTTAVQAGDVSFGDKLGGVAAGALVSGFGSIYNTAVAAGNALGGDFQQVKTYEFLQNLNGNWAQYYKENEGAIDIAGFIGTSLVPGLAAVKGLQAARSGLAGTAVGDALNFTRTRQMASLSKGLDAVAQQGGTVFTRINATKFSTIGWEFAEQTLQAAAFETAVALTMNQSPLLADNNWWEIGKGIITGAALGGAIGGVVGGFAINKAFKEGARAIDRTVNEISALGGLTDRGLARGDEALSIIDSVLKLPDNLAGVNTTIDFKFPIGGKVETFTRDITGLLTNKQKSSITTAIDNFKISIRKAAGDDTDPLRADSFAEFIYGQYSKLAEANVPKAEIRERLGDYLANLKKVSPATEPAYAAEDLMYFKKQLSVAERTGVRTSDELRNMVVRNTPFGDGNQAYDKPYVWLGTKEEFANLPVARLGHDTSSGTKITSLKDAWNHGYQMAMLPDGTLRINQESGKWRRVIDPVFDSKRYLNTRTGAVTHDTVLTVADKLPKNKRMFVNETRVEVPQWDGTTRTAIMSTGWKTNQSLDYVTARHAWASKLNTGHLPKEIDARDVSLLDRIASLTAEQRKEITIKYVDGSTSTAESIDVIRLNSKITGIQEDLATGIKDLRELAYRHNVEESWLENLIGKEFGAGVKDQSELFEGMSRPLSQYLTPENLLVRYKKPEQFIATDPASEALTWQQKREAILASASESGGQFVTGELSYAYRVQAAIEANKNAAASVLGGEVAASFVSLSQDAAKLADSIGAGASFLGSSNANYGDTLRLAAQDIGKKTHNLLQEGNARVTEGMSAVIATLINDPKVAAEVGIVTNILRNTGTKYVLAVERNDQNVIVRRMLVAREVLNARTPEKANALRQGITDSGAQVEIELSEQAYKFFDTHTAMNGERISKWTTLVNARGMNVTRDPRVVYAPPIDTNYFQHFVFVRAKEGRAFSTSEVAMVFGRNADELEQRVAAIDRNIYDVITKDGSERYHKALGDYDFDQTINERTIDSNLRRSGALANFFPETRAQNIAEDYLRFHQNQESKLIRNAVESLYAQQIQEIRTLGASHVETATSKFSGTLKASKSQIVNPYDDFVKTMLDVSKRSEYTFFHQANEFVDALGTRAYQKLSEVTGKAEKGLVSYTEANEIAEGLGLRGLYQNSDEYFLSNAPRDRNLVKETVAKANTLLANLVLRFDFAQSLMNIVSTPLLLSTELASIRTLMTKDPQLAGKLAELTTVAIPGGGGSVPSTLKLLHNAVRNFFGADKDALIQRYKSNGDIKDIVSLYHDALSDLALSPNYKVFSDRVNNATEKVAKLTGNNWSEQFTRFVSADVMRQLTEPLVDAGKMTLPEANAYISTFVNRVQGNYISSQRPIVFQGVIGGAIGLFQTYSFNLLQQLLRHVENRDVRALATMYGMQSGLFGLNGTPMFDAINTHIIGNSSLNQEHYDAYSVAPGLLGKELGDWLLYGTVSAMPGFGDKWPALYTRGDINPRHMTILPMAPQDIPFIDSSIRVVKNMMDVGKKLVSGADISQTLLQGLEHNGLNRPLAGMAQAMNQMTTTSKGGLISANSDFSLITTAARIAGAKPMDESVALNNLYRLKAYDAADQDRLEALGEVVKSHLYNNQVPPEDELMKLMADYAKIGGTAEQFNASLQRWMRSANTSVIENMRGQIRSQTGQRLNEIMGGEPLPDFRNLELPQ